MHMHWSQRAGILPLQPPRQYAFAQRGAGGRAARPALLLPLPPPRAHPQQVRQGPRFSGRPSAHHHVGLTSIAIKVAIGCIESIISHVMTICTPSLTCLLRPLLLGTAGSTSCSAGCYAWVPWWWAAWPSPTCCCSWPRSHSSSAPTDANSLSPPGALRGTHHRLHVIPHSIESELHTRTESMLA